MWGCIAQCNCVVELALSVFLAAAVLEPHLCGLYLWVFAASTAGCMCFLCAALHVKCAVPLLPAARRLACGDCAFGFSRNTAFIAVQVCKGVGRHACRACVCTRATNAGGLLLPERGAL